MRGCTPLRPQWVQGVEGGRGEGAWGWGALASGGFLLRSLLSGDTSVPHNGPFVPSPLFLRQRLTLPACSFFCLLFLSPSDPPLRENKNKTKKNAVETATIHPPPLHRRRVPGIQSGEPVVSVESPTWRRKTVRHVEAASHHAPVTSHDASARMPHPMRVGRDAARATPLLLCWFV